MTTTAKSRPVLVLVLSMFMATVGFAAVALVSAPDSSRFYKVEAQIVVNETHVASPTIVSLAGEEAVIESGSANENFELKIWANEGQRNLGEVDLKMALKFRNSQISLETKNQYALALNQWSELPLSASGNPTVKLRLRVTEAP